MGTLQAILPNGALIEREISRPSRYTHGLVVQRGDDWSLVSVHTTHAMASKNLKRLARCFVGGEAFGDYPSFEVIPLVQTSENVSPKVRDFSDANAASSVRVSPLSTNVRHTTAA